MSDSILVCEVCRNGMGNIGKYGVVMCNDCLKRLEYPEAFGYLTKLIRRQLVSLYVEEIQLLPVDPRCRSERDIASIKVGEIVDPQLALHMMECQGCLDIYNLAPGGKTSPQKDNGCPTPDEIFLNMTGERNDIWLPIHIRECEKCRRMYNMTYRRRLWEEASRNLSSIN